VIPGVDVRDTGADRLDRPGSLMPEHHREGVRGRPGDDMPITVADTRGPDAHENFALTRFPEVDLAHPDRLSYSGKDGGTCLHEGKC
jgi:hypothetical protein